MSNHYVVIMAGGRGERFWPQSRLQRPKHLLPIVGDKPMLAQTVERLEDLVPRENIFVITNREQKAAVVETVPRLPAGNVVGEPVGRDTAAAVGLATMLVKQRDPHGLFAVLPADHVIHDRKNFQAVLRRAFAEAERARVLVTIGVTPTEPATGYGYIQRGDMIEEVEGQPIYGVTRFVEKPDLATATEYLKSGDYFWNAGMFVWRVDVVEEALRDHVPELHQGLRMLEAGLQERQELEKLIDGIYPKLQKISVDYALMEKAGNVVTLTASFDWDDVGAWPAVARHYEADENKNVSRGEVLIEGGSGNIISSGDKHLVAVVGADDLIVIHTEDATLVCRKDKAQEIKKVVARLGEKPEWKSFL